MATNNRKNTQKTYVFKRKIKLTYGSDRPAANSKTSEEKEAEVVITEERTSRARMHAT